MKLALIGIGLIGGSFAAALRVAGRVESVVGFDPDPSATATAIERGIIDCAAASVADAVAGADLIVLATPVGAVANVLRQAAPVLGASAIITDVGSTKGGIVESARAILGEHSSRFVPGHPIAGGERNGVAFADAASFRGRVFISTPVVETDAAALAMVESLWAAAGARVERLGAEEHDRIFSSVSHLPHLLAFALVAQIASEPDADRMFEIAGAGFRDFTRIAAASPAMWRDICMENRIEISRSLASYRGVLDRLQKSVDTSDVNSLEGVFARASAMRRGIGTTST